MSRRRSPSTHAPTTSRTSSSCSSRATAWLRTVLWLAGAAADPQGWRRRACMCSDATATTSKPRAFAAPTSAGREPTSAASRSSPYRCGVALLLHQRLGVASVAMVFLTAVLVSAVVYRIVAGVVRLLRQRAGLQFLLSAAALHIHHRRPGERRRAVLLRRDGGDRQQPDRARAGAGDRRATAGAHHRGAVPVQPQAGGRGESRRPAVGDRASDRADAESACRHPAAGGWNGSRCAPASRRRTRWTTPTSPRRSGAGRGTAPRVAAPIRCRVPNGCSCRCRHGARRGRRRRHRQRRAGSDPDARSASAARRAGRPGRAGDRAGRIWSRTWRAHASWPRPIGCARRC